MTPVKVTRVGRGFKNKQILKIKIGYDCLQPGSSGIGSNRSATTTDLLLYTCVVGLAMQTKVLLEARYLNILLHSKGRYVRNRLALTLYLGLSFVVIVY